MFIHLLFSSRYHEVPSLSNVDRYPSIQYPSDPKSKCLKTLTGKSFIWIYKCPIFIVISMYPMLENPSLIVIVLSSTDQYCLRRTGCTVATFAVSVSGTPTDSLRSPTKRRKCSRQLLNRHCLKKQLRRTVQMQCMCNKYLKHRPKESGE